MNAPATRTHPRDSPGAPDRAAAPGLADLAVLADLTPTLWTAEQKISLDRWRQGALLPCPLLIWVSPGGPDPVTGQAAPAHGVAQQWPSAATLAIVTSQTCDVMATGPGERFPFVQVSPVLGITGVDAGRWKQLVNHHVEDRIGLTSPDLDGQWVADLRISIPVSKAVLLAASPQDAFATEADEVAFAQHLAQRVARPALHDFIVDVMVPELRAEIARAKTDTGWWSKVSEVRLLLRGSRLKPTTVRFLVLCEVEVGAAERDRWVTLSQTFRKRAKHHGFDVGAPWVQTLDQCKIGEYRSSVALHIPELRQDIGAPGL